MNSAIDIKWDLSFLYASPEDAKIKTDVSSVNNLVTKIKDQYKGKIKTGELTASQIKDLFLDLEQLEELRVVLSSFPRLNIAANANDTRNMKLLDEMQSLSIQTKNEVLFVDLELNSLPEEKFQEYFQSSELQNYQHYLQVLRLHKPYQLSEEVEQVINEMSLTGRTASVNLHTQFSASLKFPFSDGSEKTEEEIRSMFYHKDRNVRKEAYDVYNKVYEENYIINVHILSNIIKDHAFTIKRRNHPSLMNPRNISNQTTQDIVDTLMNTVKKNYPLVSRYYKLKAKLMGQDKVKGYDIYAPLKPLSKKYSWDDAKQMTLDVYNGFDPEIGNYAKEMFERNLIDAEVRKNKSAGAFCADTSPNNPPSILMSFTENLSDVSTLVHEMGHAVHAFLSDKQTMFNKNTPLILAETASVFGEQLLTNKITSGLSEKDKDIKIYMLATQIENAIATCFRQVMYTFFELEIHKKSAKGKLSVEDFNDSWKKALDECYGDSIDWQNAQKWYWSVVGHFIFAPFYCYAYAYGQLFVYGLYQKYLDEGFSFIPKYKDLLSSGGSKFPHKTAEEIGIDVTTEEFWQNSLDYISGLIDTLEKLV